MILPPQARQAAALAQPEQLGHDLVGAHRWLIAAGANLVGELLAQ